jgi:L-2-hydroxyglutarate oxidase LhgO
MKPSSTPAVAETSDVVRIGSGIMSASLVALLKGLEPQLSIRVFEATPELSREASDGWNNAGTGHAGLCELSYMPAREPDGSVKIGRARMKKMIPTYDEDLKVPANAGRFERTSRQAEEMLGLVPCGEHARKAYS